MGSNPVARGDLRARVRSDKALAAQAVLVGLLAVVAFIALPPVLGRVDAAPGDALGVYLVLVAFGIAYLVSAFAVGEVEVEGEKAPEDLLASPFDGRTVAWGKLQSSAITTIYLTALAVPPAAVVAAVRGVGVAGLAAPAVVIASLGILCGALGTVTAATVEGAAGRVAAHWVVLLVLFVGLSAWGPARAVGPYEAVRSALGGGRAWIGIAALYVAVGVAGAALVQRRFDAAKARLNREAADA